MSRIDVDTARLLVLLDELRLPAISCMWADLTVKSDREAWPAVRFLSAPRSLEVNRSVGRTNRIIIPDPTVSRIAIEFVAGPLPPKAGRSRACMGAVVSPCPMPDHTPIRKTP